MLSGMDHAGTGMLHHIELWVPELTRAEASWGWLLGKLGYHIYQEWPEGKSWRAGVTYIVIEQSPDRVAGRHDRCRPGLNHLAFHVASREELDELVLHAPDHGWRLLYPDRHPFAGETTTTPPTWRTGKATKSSWSRRRPRERRGGQARAPPRPGPARPQ